MKKEYFTDNISDKTLVMITDKMLKVENNKKNNKTTPSLLTNLLKLIPAAACVLLMIGLVNVLPAFINSGSGGVGSEGIVIGEPDIEINLPVIYPTATEEITEDTDTTEEIAEEAADDDPYTHVRFGETRDILLLDIEWHTYDTYLEEINEIKSYVLYKEYRNSDEYIKLDDKDKEQIDQSYEYNESWAQTIEYMEKNLERIKNGDMFIVRFINGDYPNYPNVISSFDELLPEYFDSDGYYIFEIYPLVWNIYYFDENGEYINKWFGWDNYVYISSKREYDVLLQEQIIPYCDDLLSKGLITQEYYDTMTIKDPLDYYVNLYF